MQLLYLGILYVVPEETTSFARHADRRVGGWMGGEQKRATAGRTL